MVCRCAGWKCVSEARSPITDQLLTAVDSGPGSSQQMQAGRLHTQQRSAVILCVWGGGTDRLSPKMSPTVKMGEMLVPKLDLRAHAVLRVNIRHHTFDPDPQQRDALMNQSQNSNPNPILTRHQNQVWALKQPFEVRRLNVLIFQKCPHCVDTHAHSNCEAFSLVFGTAAAGTTLSLSTVPLRDAVMWWPTHRPQLAHYCLAGC